MRSRKAIVVGFVLFLIYTIFWFWFFETPQTKNIKSNIKQQVYSAFSGKDTAALNTPTYRPLPQAYEIPIDSRRQSFNLSCEFAGASGIIYHFTNNQDFSPASEEEAEKKLIDKAWISRNPNVGIRMGLENITDLDTLYKNLNEWFGGSDYYGIHAPPFIDLFAKYKLTAKPIYINDSSQNENSTISSIKKAIANNHLVMAWIKIGYTKSVDDYLSYGAIRIIRGEHTIIINGYDQNGVIVMDPGTGLKRNIEYRSLIDASSFFPMPFLEVYKNVDNEVSFDNLTIGFDTMTGIDRSIPKIYVENGAGNTGVANQMRDILKDFGYSVIGTGNADNFNYQDITIKTKKGFSDFLYILKRDIKIASFAVASASADLATDDTKDIVVIVGK